MESATAMLFSKANLNAKLSKESAKEEAKEIPNEEEKQEIQKEVIDNLSSLESGINSISMNKKENEEPKVNIEDKNITTFNSVDDFFFPIVNNKSQEESKNSEANIISTKSKESQDKSNNFSSINLKIPDNIRPINNISTSPTTSMNINMNMNLPQNIGQMFSPNFSISPNPMTIDFFGLKFFKNYNLSFFVPITFTCSLDTHKGRKSQNKSKQEEKEFFEKIIKIADVENMSEFWQVFQHLKKPNQCPIGTDYHIFKKGIIPMWEDEKNKHGGKLSVLLTWKLTNIIWEEATFNFAKGLLPHYEYINGIVISMRPKFAVLSFWIKTNTSSAVEKIRNALSVMLQAPSPNCIDFIPFNN